MKEGAIAGLQKRFSGLFSRIALPVIIELVISMILLLMVLLVVQRQFSVQTSVSFLQLATRSFEGSISSSLDRESVRIVDLSEVFAENYDNIVVSEETDGVMRDNEVYFVRASDRREFHVVYDLFPNPGVQSAEMSMVLVEYQSAAPLAETSWMDQVFQYPNPIWIVDEHNLSFVNAVAIFGESREFLGMLLKFVRFEDFQERIVSSFSSPGVALYMFDGRGNQLFSSIQGLQEYLSGSQELGTGIPSDRQVLQAISDSIYRFDTLYSGPDTVRDALDFDVEGFEILMQRFFVPLSGDEYLIGWMVVPAQIQTQNGAGRNPMMFFAALLLLISIFIIFTTIGIFSHWIQKPLVTLSNAAAAYAAQDWNAPLPEWRNDEIGSLGKSLSRMAVQLKELVNSMERKIEHRTWALMDSKQALERSLDELAQTQGELEKGRQLHAYPESLFRTPVPLAHILDILSGQMDGRDDAEGITLQIRIEQLEHIRLSAALLWQILSNLLDNSIRHGYAAEHTGGSIDIDVSASGRDMLIVFEDYGRGMSATVLDRIRSQGAQLPVDPEAAPGMGLRVAIDLVKMAGGEFSIDSKPGSGCRITMHLPGVVVIEDRNT